MIPQVLAKRPELGRILGNSAWLIADRVSRMAVGLVLGAWIARHLGPSGLGQMSYVIALVAFFAAIANLGLDGIAVKRFIDAPQETEKTLATVFMMRICGGTVAWVAAIAAAWVISEDAQAVALVALYGVTLLVGAVDAIDLWFQSQLKSKYTVLSKNVAFLVTALIRVALILCDLPVVWFIAAMAAEAVIASAMLIMAFRRWGEAGTLRRPDMRIASEMVRQSWPLILSGIMVAVYIRVDQVLIAKLLGYDDLGVYAAALKLFEIWQIIPMALVPSAAPSIARAKSTSTAEYEQKLVSLFRALFYCGIAIAGVMAISAPWIIHILYGTRYADAALVLTVIAWALPFLFLGVAINPWTVNEGKMRLTLWRTACGALTSIGLALVLLPRHGVVGGAIAMVAAQAITNFGLNLILPDARPLLRLQLRALFAFAGSKGARA